jgi:serine protease AprX
MATPVAGGEVALMLQKDPTLSPDTVKARIMKTASRNFPAYSTATDASTGQTCVSAYDLFTMGAGYVDIATALSSSDVASKRAASPR